MAREDIRRRAIKSPIRQLRANRPAVRPATVTSTATRHGRNWPSPKHAKLLSIERRKNRSSTLGTWLVDGNLARSSNNCCDLQQEVMTEILDGAETLEVSLDPFFKSPALQLETDFFEAMTASHHHARPSKFRSSMALRTLVGILPQMGGFRHLISSVCQELTQAIYSLDGNGNSAENGAPYFDVARERKMQLSALRQQFRSLKRQYDHVLEAQLASSGSVSLIVERWRRKVLDVVFTTWRSIARISADQKCATIRASQLRKQKAFFRKVFKEWHTAALRLALGRTKKKAIVADTLSVELEEAAETIKNLRRDVKNSETQIALLIDQQTRLQDELHDTHEALAMAKAET